VRLGPLTAGFILPAALLSCSGPRQQRALSVSLPHDVTSLDPHRQITIGNVTLALNLYEPLVTASAGLGLEPSLAESWETPDRRTWLFHLRHGVRFHDGHPFSAEDAAFSIRRLRDTPQLGASSYVACVDEATAVDEHTLRIHTNVEINVFLSKLRFAVVVPAGSTAESLENHPNGTGPYAFEGWRPGEVVHLRRNDTYWGRGGAYESVTLLLARGPNEAVSDLAEGRSQIVECDTKDCLKELQRGGRTVLDHPGLFVKFLGLAWQGGGPEADLLHDIRVRQAIDAAVDRDALRSQLTITTQPVTQLVPPAVFGFDPSIPEPRHDPDRARKLLRDAGHAAGIHAVLLGRSILGPTTRIVRDQLDAAGIHLDLEELPDTAFLDTLAKRRTGIYVSRFSCPTGDATDLFGLALHSKDAKRLLGLQNFPGYSNAELDLLIEKSFAMNEQRSRQEILQKAMRTVLEDEVMLPLYVDEEVYGLAPGVRWKPREDSLFLAADAQPSSGGVPEAGQP
jgi:peptide/nickel transport system substrate-binding protein